MDLKEHEALIESEQIDFRELLDTLWSGRWLALSVFSVIVFISIAYVISAQPVYRASGLMQVEYSKNAISTSVDQLSSLIEAKPSEASAEVAIVKSRMVFSTVVNRLRLDIKANPRYFPLIGRAIARNYKSSEVPAHALMGMRRFAWGGESIQVTAFDVPSEQLDSVYTLEATQDGFVLRDKLGVEILHGKIGERATGKQLGEPIAIFVQELRAEPGTQFQISHLSPSSVFDWLNGAVSVLEQPKDSGILSIQADASSPELAAALLNEVESSYLTQNVERRSTQAQQSLDFLKKQLPELKDGVEQAQNRLNAYQLKAGTVDVQQETQLILKQAVDLETQRLTLVQEREAAKQRYTDQHPTVLTLNDQIGGIQREQAAIKQRTEALPERQQEVLSLMRDLEVSTQLYTALLNSAQQLQITKAGTTGNVRIVDRALAKPIPVKPLKTVIILIGMFLGSVLGISAVFAARALLRGVDKPEEIERATGLPCYALIPYSKTQAQLTRQLKSKKLLGNKGTKLLALHSAEDMAMESLRSLRTTLHFAMLEARNNIINFTGPTAGVGKSFVTINLGATLALTGKKVIVIDADLRRGFLHRHLDLRQFPGLSDYIADTCTLETILQNDIIENLDFLPCGSRAPNPSEILMNPRFEILLKLLSQRYDYVLVDTPPALPVTDAAIVGRLSGTTLLVLKSAEHPMRAIIESTRRLRRGGATVQGIIINQMGARIGSHGYSYNYGSYRNIS